MTDDYDDEQTPQAIRPSYPPNLWGYTYNLAVFASRIAAEVSNVIALFAADFGAHNNWAIERREERAHEKWEADQRTLLADDLRSLEMMDDS